MLDPTACRRGVALMQIRRRLPRQRRRWCHGGPAYDDFLRHLQNQVVARAPLLEDGKRKEKDVVEFEPGGDPSVPYVGLNKLLASPDAPKDGVMLFRDIDNVRALAQRAGSDACLRDEDCATLCLEMIREVQQGRQTMTDIVKHFERMEAHPDFYKAGNRAYNVMIFNSLARDYPNVAAPSEMFGRMIKGGKAPGWWTYVLLARVEMHLPPVERRAFKDAFVSQVREGGLTPYDASRAIFWIERLRWLTDSVRLLFYALSVAAALCVLSWAVEKRKRGRAYREKLDDAIFEQLDEVYYGDPQLTEGGRQGAGLSARGGLRADDSD